MVYQVVKKNHLRGYRDRFYPYLIFIGLLTFRGRKGQGALITDALFSHVRKTYKVEPLIFFRFFFEKFRPKVFMYSKRIAGITYKIPTPVSYRKSVSLLLHWWLNFARKNRSGQKFFPVFLREMDNAYKLNESNISKKRDEIHKLAHFNRPFLRYLKFLSMAFFRFLSSTGGRNNCGRITVRHRGSSVHSRFSSFLLSYFPPSRSRSSSAIIRSLGSYFLTFSKLARRKFTLAIFRNRLQSIPKKFYYKPDPYAKFGALPLHQVQPGSFTSFLQLHRGGKPTFARSPGTKIQVIRRRGSYTVIKLPSGELRRLHTTRWSIFNHLSYRSYRPRVYFKAGEVRQLGRRPHVRGCAMNPVDHPHGGRTGESRPSVTPWGKLTKGPRTRRRPIDPKFILRTVRQYKDRRRLFLYFTHYA